MTIYTVRNIAGGTLRFTQLSKAVEAAGQHMMEPYVESFRGRRPVYCGELGEYGETWEEMRSWVLNRV